MSDGNRNALVVDVRLTQATAALAKSVIQDLVDSFDRGFRTEDRPLRAYLAELAQIPFGVRHERGIGIGIQRNGPAIVRGRLAGSDREFRFPEINTRPGRGVRHSQSTVQG